MDLHSSVLLGGVTKKHAHITSHNSLLVIGVGHWQTSARVSLLRVEIENETSQGNVRETIVRMRVFGEKLRVENESTEGKNEIEIENETLNCQEWGSD